MAAKEMNRRQDGPAKKPYECPRLEVYGDIREVTMSVSMMGMSDGATMGMNKTG